MPMTNAAAQFIAWRLGSSLSDMYIGAVAVGSGSGTALITNTTLVNEHTRHVITGSPNFETNRKVTFQGDFNATELSGTQILEFGLFQSGTYNTGSVWFREAFGSIVMDGTIELQTLATLDVLPG